MLKQLVQFIYDWQTLVGSLLGAGVPISLWFIKENYENYKIHKEYLDRLVKIIISNLNYVKDVHNIMNRFVKNNLQEVINNIDQRTKSNQYSFDNTFLPLIPHPIDDHIFNDSTKSNYLDNKILQAFKMSKDIATGIDDLRGQLANTLEINRNMIFNKANDPQIQNDLYKSNIEDFKKIIEHDILGSQLKIYLRVLASAYVGINFLQNHGILYWQFKFQPHFKFFKSKKNLQRFKEDLLFHSIDKFFKEKVDAQVSRVETFFTI